MKSKTIATIMAVTVAMSTIATGCASQTWEQVQETAPEVEVQEQTQEESTQEQAEEPVEEETVTGGGQDYLLPFAYEPDKFFAVDSDGNPAHEYDFSKIKDAFEYIDAELNSGNIMLVSGDTVIIEDTVEADASFSEYYAYNIETGNVVSIMTTEPGYYGSAYVDLYGDKIYIGATKYRSGDENGDFKEYEITLKDDGSYEAQEGSYPAVESYFETHTWVHPHVNIGYESYGANYNFSLKRILDDYGFVIAHRVGILEGGYEKIDADGTCTELETVTGDSVSILGYNKEWLVYEVGESGAEVQKALNLESGEEFEIEAQNDIDCLEIIGNKCYFKTETENFGSNAAYVYECDFETKELNKIYTKENMPLADKYYSNSYIIGHSFFYQKVDDDQLKWYRVDMTAPDGDGEDTGFDIREISAFKYGDIKYDSKEDNCPFCGIPMYKGYEEVFVLKSEYSAHADEINAFFEDMLKQSMERSYEMFDEPTDDGDCADHKDMPWAYCETDESYITDVNIVKGKYLTVNYESYWYSGGAHGMPSKNQYIFDLETGEQKTVRDFFKGTEEDFKKLVAEKTKEDFLNGNNVYFAQDENAVYEDALDSAGFDFGPFFITEDSAVFSFTPYDLGPFSSGFIDIELPIDQFNF